MGRGKGVSPNSSDPGSGDRLIRPSAAGKRAELKPIDFLVMTSCSE